MTLVLRWRALQNESHLATRATACTLTASCAVGRGTGECRQSRLQPYLLLEYSTVEHNKT